MPNKHKTHQAANNETARDVLTKHFKLSRKQVDMVAQHMHRSMDSEPLFEVCRSVGKRDSRAARLGLCVCVRR